MHVIKKEKNEIFSLPAAEISLEAAAAAKSPLARRVLAALAESGELFAADIARRLGVHEQKVYYHLRQMERAGFIAMLREESGAKYYSLRKPAFVLALRPYELTSRIAQRGESSYLDPFLHDGQLNALIVVGSPDPHGPEKARSRDGHYAVDLGLFLGTFLNYVPDLNVALDTEVRDADLQRNLILVGGPIVNAVTGRVNEHLPIYFDRSARHALRSSVSGKTYPEDECGLVCSVPHPLSEGHRILLVAGKRYAGTRAAILALLKHFEELTKGNKHDRSVHARVVEGVDRDSDGLIDDIEFRE